MRKETEMVRFDFAEARSEPSERFAGVSNENKGENGQTFSISSPNHVVLKRTRCFLLV